MEADAASNRPRIQAHRVRCVDDLWIHFEVLEDAVEQRQRALDLHLYVEQLAEREKEPALERREGDDHAGRRGGRVAAGGKRPGKPVHERWGDREARADDPGATAT